MTTFKTKPKRIIDDVYDFIGETTDDFVVNYEEIAQDTKGNKQYQMETSIISNCCEIAIQSYFPVVNSTVLDIGCGWGEIINNIPVKYKCAVDISLEKLRQVSFKVTRIRANAEDVPLESNQFNFIIATDIMEHVQNVEAVRDEIYRLLTPRELHVKGGLLCLAFPWEQDISIYDSKEYLERYKRYKYIHLRSINQELLDNLFEKNFRIVAETMITAPMAYMTLKPYPIKFICYEKYS